MTNQKAQHTPGPWRVEQNGRASIIICMRDGKAYSFTIAETFGYKEERESNARLIASAPDLLAACKRVAEWGKVHGTPEIQGILCDVHSAIEKAEAQQ